MTTVVRRNGRRFPDLFDLAESLPGLFAMGTRVPCMEEYTEDDTYVIRAELPGLDPEKDIKVEVESGVLRISAERHESQREHLHTEFRYGTYIRRVALPEGADEAKMTARYDAGILEITVPITTEAKQAHRIPIDTAD